MYNPISIQVAPYDQMFGLEKNVFKNFFNPWTCGSLLEYVTLEYENVWWWGEYCHSKTHWAPLGITNVWWQGENCVTWGTH